MEEQCVPNYSDFVIYPELCACCCKVPGTVEAVIYSAEKINEIRGCGCGNAVLNQYATNKVRICKDCRMKIDLDVSKRRIRNMFVLSIISLITGYVYYQHAGKDVYVSIIVSILPFLAGYRWILLDERMTNGLYIGKLIRSKKIPSGYIPVFVNKEFQDMIES